MDIKNINDLFSSVMVYITEHNVSRRALEEHIKNNLSVPKEVYEHVMFLIDIYDEQIRRN